MDTSLATSRWTGLDRILLVLLLVVFSLGIPGVGVETREGSNSPLLSVAYSVALLAPLLALGASWKWARAAAWAAVTGGVLAVVLTVLDLAGVLGGPPPMGMVVVNVVVAILGATIAWRSWRLARS